MHPADILKQNYPPSILIYGFAGTKKTALVTQLSGAYGFDFDRGMRTAATLKDKFFDARQRFTFDEYRDEDPKKPKMFQAALKKLGEIVEKSAKGTWEHDACIVDSLTGLCRAAQLHVQSLGDKSNPLGDSMAKMEIQNWGSLIHEVERFLTMLRSLRVLTVVTAHIDANEKKKLGGTLGETIVSEMYPMSATSKHGLSKLMWLFDEVWYADMRPIGQGKMSFRINGMPVDDVIKVRTRSSMGLIVHDEIGLVEILKKMGYEYGKRASGTETLVGLEKTSK